MNMDSHIINSSSNELLRVEAQMDKVPAILNLKAKQKAPFSKGATFKPLPSSVLQRARNFLPMMAQANADVEKQLSTLPPGAFDIEAVDDIDGPVIEMNIALVEREDCSDDSDEDSDDSVSDDSSMSDEEASSNHTNCSKGKTCVEGGEMSEVTECTLRLSAGTACSRHRPVIEVLDTNKCHSLSGMDSGNDLQLSDTVTKELESREDLDLSEAT